ncbi:MAG: TetR/AcrR family transcriptional regulator [Terriglobia bacterium]
MPRLATPRNSRAALLAAAERIFAERGIAGARTQEIAAAARVNKALLHYYFDTKEKLYQAVLDNLFRKLVATARAALAHPHSPRTSLLQFVDAYFEFLKTHPNYPRLIQREVMSRSPFLRTIAARYFGPLHRRLARVLRAGIRQRLFRPVDVPNTVITLIGITVFYFAAAPVLTHLLGADPYHATRLAARKRAVLDFVRHGLLTHPARALPSGEA